jgi:hypothetical protein
MKIYPIFTAFMFSLFMLSCSDSVDSDPENGNENGDTDPPAELKLVNFWYFDVSLANDTELETIDATFSAGTGAAFIEYRSALAGYPNTGRDASMERRNRPTAINYRPEGNANQSYASVADSMRAIQVRDPFLGNAGQNMLIFHLPTTGFEDPVFSFAAMDEDAANGLKIDYSVTDDGENWITTGLSADVAEQDLITGEYLPYEIDFSGINSTYNNPDFKIRIRFDVDDGTQNEDNRVTFNNFALDAVSID